MSTSTTSTSRLQPASGSRILREGYGPGAWHGADLKAALTDVPPQLAFRRPGPGRHNIAEIAVHHAWSVRNVIAQLSGEPAAPFELAGEDWFDLSDQTALDWRRVVEIVAREQTRLAQLVENLEAGTLASPLSDEEQITLILGVTCHAVYHAGQIQLIKRLHDA